MYLYPVRVASMVCAMMGHPFVKAGFVRTAIGVAGVRTPALKNVYHVIETLDLKGNVLNVSRDTMDTTVVVTVHLVVKFVTKTLVIVLNAVMATTEQLVINAALYNAKTSHATRILVSVLNVKLVIMVKKPATCHANKTVRITLVIFKLEFVPRAKMAFTETIATHRVRKIVEMKYATKVRDTASHVSSGISVYSAMKFVRQTVCGITASKNLDSAFHVKMAIMGHTVINSVLPCVITEHVVKGKACAPVGVLKALKATNVMNV